MRKILLIAIVLFSVSCEPRQGKRVEEAPVSKTSDLHEIVVEEVLQANNYTYVKALEQDKEIWMAIMKADIEVGKKYYYEEAMEMKDFDSKDLNRHFDSVYFLSGLLESPEDFTKSGMKAPNDPMHGKKEPATQKEINIEPEDGVVSIKALYENRDKYEGSKVVVKGIVTKYNPNIMNKNWVHIQDGTGNQDYFDLTITSSDQVQKGDLVKFEGVLALDKDFGHGYQYDLILEQASLLNNPSAKVN